MKRSLILIGMELKYLLRQKFLWILVLVGIALSVFQAPRSRIDLDYTSMQIIIRTTLQKA